MKIVIPGGAGLVGQNLVARLAGRGHELVVIDKHHHNLRILQQMHPEVAAIEADLAEDGPWAKALADADSVVMLQAQIGDLQEGPFQRNNIDATSRVLDAMATHGVDHLVHISSSVVNSAADDFYTRSKTAQEALVLASDIPSIVLRPTLMFGWFDRKHLGWLSRFMARVPVFPVPADGRFMRQPLYAGDFCKIIERCIDRRLTGATYDITGLEQRDYIDIIRDIKTITGANARITCIPYWLFYLLLATWALFDRNPPFTTSQLSALVADDEFEVIDWPGIFEVEATPLRQALEETFLDPRYRDIVLEF